MDGAQIIVALAASSSQRARDKYWEGVLAGVELVIDKAASEGRLSDEWMSEVRDFIAVAREHQP
jgi:hypothetical protein